MGLNGRWLTRSLPAAALWLVAAPASAARLTWSAPAGCPQEEEVRARVTRELGVELERFEAALDLTFKARAQRSKAGFELLLSTERDGGLQERRIQATSCDALVDALAAAVALALQSARDEAPEATKPVEGGATEPVPVAPPPRPREAPARAAKPASAPATVVPIVALGAVLDAATFPAPAFGGELLLGLRLAYFKVLASGQVIPEHEASLGGSARGRFQLVQGGLSLCYLTGSPVWDFGGCVGGALGRLRASGVNVRNPRQSESLWAAVCAGAWLAVRPLRSGWGLFAWPGLLVPLLRQPLELTRVGIVHEPAALGFVATAGLELELR